MNITCFVNKFAMILVIVGALNWGLVGGFDYNLVTRLFGDATTMMTVVYVAIGVAAVYTALMHCICCKDRKCGSDKK